jgi:S-adenosylmethionine hydrolase
MLSDFGRRDPYLAELRAALMRQWQRFPAREAWPQLVDLGHEIPPGEVRAAAWFLQRTAWQFPAGSVHLAVVDPGVGTDRPAVAARAAGHFFVAPGNGLLSFLTTVEDLQVVRLDRSNYRQAPAGLPLSTTFDGRDLFAPVAAHLAMGVSLAQVGSVAAATLLGALPAAAAPRGDDPREGIGLIVWIDHFGNAVSDIERNSAVGATLAAGARISLAGHEIDGPLRSYGEAAVDVPFWYWGSGDTLEVAWRDGNLAERLDLKVGLVIGHAAS